MSKKPKANKLCNLLTTLADQMALRRLPETNKKATDVSSTKRTLKLVMKWLVYAWKLYISSLVYTILLMSQYSRIESYCSLTKNFQLAVLN